MRRKSWKQKQKLKWKRRWRLEVVARDVGKRWRQEVEARVRGKRQRQEVKGRSAGESLVMC